MLIGIYGLLFEGYNPGAIVPGVVGAICLLLALFAFQVLPVNYAGLALIILGVVLIIAESLVPSFGALGFGGVAAFVFGSIILLDTEIPGMQIARPLIFGIALAASLLLLLLVYLLMKIRRRPAVSGADSMLGQVAEALDDFRTRGCRIRQWRTLERAQRSIGQQGRQVARHEDTRPDRRRRTGRKQ